MLLLGLGLLAARRTRTLKGFLLADRSLGPWVTALSAEATAMSGWLLIAFPARAFTHGLSAVWVGLACVLGVGALLLAVPTDPWNPESTVYRLVLYAWSGLSGCFTAPVLMALFYRRMTRSGCLAGILCGGATSRLWHHFPPLGFAAYELIPAVLVSALSIWSVSRLSGNSSHRQQV